MKKVLIKLLLLLVLCIPVTMKAQQQQLTVYNGTTTTKSTVPMYCSYFDDFSRSQFVIPADSLTAMLGSSITSIKYYTTSSNIPYTTVSTVDIYLTEVVNTSISAFVNKSDCEIVYTGTVAFTAEGDGGTCEIVFETPYLYQGGNLLIGCENINDLGYKFIYFNGVTVNGSSVAGYNASSLNAVTASQQNFIPKTTFTYTSSSADICYAPTALTTSQIATDGATFSWTSREGQTSYEVYCGTGTIDLEQVEWIPVSDTFYTFTGLNANTSYTAYVRASCGDQYSNAKSTTFRTACDLISTLPFTENFEAVPSGSYPMPFCWTKGAANTTYPYSYSSTTAAHAGSRGLYFSTANSAILPEIDPDAITLSEAQLTFWAKTGTAGTVLQIGILDEDNTFDLICALPLTTAWKQYTIPFHLYEGTGTRVVLRNLTSTAIYVDDLSLEEVADCTMPVNVTCSPTENSATFNCLSTATSFNLYYKEATASEWDVEEDVTLPYTLTGLNSNTEYKYYIQTACGLETEFTTDSATFRTIIAATSLPYEATFDESDEWIIDNGTCVNKWMIDDIGSNVTGLFVTRDAVSKIKKYNISSASTVIAQKIIEVGTNASFSLDFDFKCGGESTFDYIKVFLAPTSSTYPASTATTAPSYAVSGYSTYAADFSETLALLNQTNTPYKLNLTGGNTIHVTVLFDNPIPEAERDESSIAKLVFLWRNDGSLTGDTTSAIISNVHFNAISCSRVSELTCSEIDATSATISWSQGDGASNFVVQYKANGQSWSEENTIEVQDTTANLIGLSPATPYQVRVATLCGSDTSVWRTGNFVTACAPISVPYYCDFETVPSGSNQLPYCWHRLGSTSYPYSISSTSSHNGSRSLYFLPSSYHNTMAILPEIDTETFDVRDLQLSFFSKISSSVSYYHVEVGVMSNPDSVSTFIPLYSFIPTTSYPANAQVFPLMEAPQGHNFVAIRVTGDYSSSYTSYTVYVDDLVLDLIPECSNPLYLDAYTQSTTADLSWVATGNSFNVYYKAPTDEEFSVATDVTFNEDGVYTLEELTANTEYQWYVVSVCDDGTERSSDTATFTTKCAPLTLSQLPQSWDFESNNTAGTTSYPLPTCWERITNPDVSTLYPYSYNAGTNAHSGTRALYFYNYYPNAYAIMPQIDENVDITNLQISFFGKRSSAASTKLLVGVMDNYTDASTFTTVDTIDLPTAHPDDPIVVTFEEYEGTGTYIAFKNITSSSSYFYIDDITLSTIPTCDNPTGVSVNPDSTFAYLAWNDMTEGSYNVYVKLASEEEWGEPVLSNYTPEDTILLTDLLGGTDYQCRVATVCADGEEASAFPVPFTTLCTSYPAPFSENFDASSSLPNCWSRYSGLITSNTISSSSFTSSTNWTIINTNVFGQYHAKLNIYGTVCKHWLVSPLINLSGLENPALIFDLALTDWNNADPIEDNTAQQDDRFIVLISTDNGATWSLDNATVWDNTGNGDFVYNAIPNTGEQIQISLADYAGQSIRIAFYGESTASGGDNDLHIDNISVNEALSCLKPNGLFVSEIHNNRATVVWNQADESDSWLVEYDTVGFEPGTGHEVEVSGDPTATLIDLIATTTYEVYVKTACAESASGYTDAVKTTFTTTCDPIGEIPQTWDFESNNTAGTTSYPMPACWSKFPVSGTYPYVYNSSTSAHAGSRYLYFYNGTKNTYAILKELDVETYPINTLMLSFYAKASSASAIASLEVGVMTSPTDTSSFVPVMTLSNLPTTYGSTPFIVPFNSYEGEGSYIALRNVFNGSATNAFYIDDMTLNFLPDCITPINVHADNVTSNSITLAWTADEDDSQWEIAYAAHAFNPDTVTAILVDENPFLVEGLTDNTTYQFYVRTICSDNEPSDWSLPVSITTPCVPVVVTEDEPFMENFNTLTSGIPGCWDNSEGTTTDASYKWNYYATGETGHCLRFNSYLNSNGKTNMLKTPVLDLSQITTAQLSFSYKNPTGGDFSVFVSTDGGNTYNTAIATGLTGATNWTPVTYLLEGLTDYENVVIVFKGTSNYGNGDAYIYLDNVEVGNAPSCVKPSNVSVTDVTSNSATLSWTAPESQNAWEILYGAHGFNPETAGTTVSNVTTNPYTVTGLTSLTNYDFYVRANCGTDGVSEWSNALSVTTAMESVNLPYSTTFEATSDQQWFLNNGTLTNHWTMGTIQNHGALYVTKDSTSATYTHSATTVMAEKLFNMPTSDSVHVEFDLKVGGEANTNYTYDYLKVFLAPANAVFTAGANQNDYSHSDSSRYAMNFSAYGSQLGAPNHPYSACLSTGTIHISQNMPIPANSSTAKLVFLWRNDSSSGDGNSAIISNFSIAPVGSTPVVTLPSVTTVAADPVGQTTATLNATITNPDGVAITGKGFQWKVNGGDYQNVTGSGSGNTFVANLTNLTANTQYFFKAYIMTADTTVYGEELPFTTSSTPTPPATPTVTTNDATYTQTMATLYASINNPSSVNITGKGFQWKVNGGNYQNAAGTGTGNDFSAELTNLTPNTQYFYKAYITTADTTVYGAELNFTTLPEDVEPCATPTGLNTTDITKESVKVIWDNVDGVIWHIQYRQGDGAFSTADASTNSYVITDLNPETTYEIQVQADCGDGNVSAWATTTATTLADGVNNYLENSVVLYPNPAKEVINVQCTMNEWNGATIEVLDVYGKLLQTLKADSEITQINVSNLANGMYFVRMTTEQGVVTKRFVKK